MTMSDQENNSNSSIDDEPFGKTGSTNADETNTNAKFMTSQETLEMELELEDSNSGAGETASSSGDESSGKIIYKRAFEWYERGTARYIKRPIKRGVVEIARISATYPMQTVILTILLSFGLLVLGFYTNFNIIIDGDVLWSPSGSIPASNQKWIDHESGFAPYTRNVRLLVHADGNNVLTMEGANCLFDAIDAARAAEGYREVCQASHGEDECPIYAATSIFDHNRTKFLEKATSDKEVQLAMSRLVLDSGRPVIRSFMFGYPYPELPANLTTYRPGLDPALFDTLAEMGDSAIDTFGSLFGIDRNDTILQSALSYTGDIPLSPYGSVCKGYEKHAYEALYALNDQWAERGVQCTVEVYTIRGFDDEVMRGVIGDAPFMASAFLIMGCFCAFYLSKRKSCVQSQSVLGAGAVGTIILSIMSGYGLNFLIGVPFTNVTQIFPYVMVGIGLDDTFIITGEFARRNPRDDIVERIVKTMDEIGISIFVSTLTTVVAFFLGCFTSLPGIRWFCWYASSTVMIDFIYQISFFIALMVLDDRRIQANRYDCLVCVKAPRRTGDDNEDESFTEKGEDYNMPEEQLASKVMLWYAEILLKPLSKVIVLVSFLAFLCLGVYGASQQRQAFDFRDLTPADSFIRTYFDAFFEFTSPEKSPYLFVALFFRDVDFSLNETHKQMRDYIEDLVDLEFISRRPEFFWLDDFELFVEREESVANMTFSDQMDVFLSTTIYDELYGKDIVRDENGEVTATRCNIIFDQSSLTDVPIQIASLKGQRDVTEKQEINEGNPSDWPFFAFSPLLFIWELFSVVFSELLSTLILGLVSVFVISSLFIPHPFGALVLTPVVAAIYCEIMAFLYFLGIYINGVSLICLIMSVGLVIDYNMHVVLTYFEIEEATSRDDRVRKVLSTMGASIVVGGFSTFLGVLPLCMTGTLVFKIFFYSFLAIPTIGIAHGLILLPVILSLWGPRLPNSSDEKGRKELDKFFEMLPESLKVTRLEI